VLQIPCKIQRSSFQILQIPCCVEEHGGPSYGICQVRAPKSCKYQATCKVAAPKCCKDKANRNPKIIVFRVITTVAYIMLSGILSIYLTYIRTYILTSIIFHLTFFRWLVVSNIFYFPFHIWDVTLPINMIICFKMVKTPPTSWHFVWHQKNLCTRELEPWPS